MNCPVCKTVNLVLSERQGIEIDYCPQCRGVWLDRGELNKIIERSLQEETPARPAPPTEPRYTTDKYYEKPKDRYYDDDYKYNKGYKKKSILGELFDF